MSIFGWDHSYTPEAFSRSGSEQKQILTKNPGIDNENERKLLRVDAIPKRH